MNNHIEGACYCVVVVGSSDQIGIKSRGITTNVGIVNNREMSQPIGNCDIIGGSRSSLVKDQLGE